ncbi:MAG: hypothetical protein A2600_06050 [Candidatus Lambdaproteobacteria bacterium RIFOXYD1_FULL_56_27]|uniref:Response regulatory domain-containing protein n=1 Tax=Candidatus Lambdaproteobacteria bacterium RIFOXYD2_FULL_56_26 TaxID=1817773 RepID=A0A1F6GM77_9PROT|nr:MAG: hypothetical protein A2557_10175 [Candidatus Lambdaproteobacteria bacterium RIFOXYD2_FULL_56_26]OGH01770.1 MAG: hypothetical protein A2426_14090 [Candidatus Lambdaproteobacteria bacterium RIFOXYC1_FULL_56_13]OGH07643.1 MAG: hypothetical protein A2600_06050 [Candidatus Lambdaproteobacteria bacterium RIFOXYD1_FULL_56_27]
MELLQQIRQELAKNLKVMVVDDESQILSALRREFHSQPFELKTYSDPEEALVVLGKEEFAVIISDNLMPKMLGLEFLARAKAINGLARRILLTGKTEQQEAIKAFNQGVIHRFLDKPWNHEELLAILAEDLESFLLLKLEDRLDQIKNNTLKKRNEDLEKTRRDLADTQTELVLEKTQHAEKPLSLPANLQNFTYLIIDKNKTVAESLAATLKRAGASLVEVVDNGMAGLTKLTDGQQTFDVVLSEWDLEKISGLTLLRTIRERQDLVVQPYFLFVTSLINRESVEYAHNAKADGYLLKPFSLERLVQQLEELNRSGSRPARRYSVNSLKKLTVLVVNKDATKRLFLQKCLGEVEVKKYLLADSGTKALKLLVRENVDVILYDSGLKDPEWANLTQKLQNIGCRSDQPIVVTAYSEPEAPVRPVNPAAGAVPGGPEEAPVGPPKPGFFLPPSFSQEDFNRVLLAALESMS